MALFSGSHTRRLAGASLELTSRRGARNVLLTAVAGSLLLAVTGAGLQFVATSLAPPAKLSELQRENAKLREDVERARIELEVERATRSELDRQVVELNERVSQLSTELSFYVSHSGKVGKAR